MSDQQELIQRAPLPRALWSLSWPLVAAHEIHQIVLTILIFWLGRIIGEQGLEVESLFRPIELFGLWFFLGPAIGVGALVSRSVGAEDGKGLAIVGSTVTLNVIFLGSIALLSLPFSHYIADVLGGERAPAMFHYLLPWLVLALPGLAMTEFLLSVIESAGFTTFGLLRSAVDIAIIAGLVPLALWGIGIGGAPLAAGAGSLGLSVILLITILRRHTEFKLGDVPKKFFHKDWAVWREVMAVGMPVVGVRMTTFGAQAVMLHGVGQQSPVAAAGFGIAMVLILYSAAVTQSIGQAGSIIVGQCLGAGLHDRAKRAVPATLLAAVVVTAVFVALTTVSAPLLRFLGNYDSIAIEAGNALSIMRWGLFGICTWQIGLAALTAHKATARAGLLSAVSDAIGLGVFLLWPGPNLLTGATIAFCVANGLKAIAFMTILRLQPDHPPAAEA